MNQHDKSNNNTYRIYHMYSDRQAWANSLDRDETPQNAASHLGIHVFATRPAIFRHNIG